MLSCDYPRRCLGTDADAASVKLLVGAQQGRALRWEPADDEHARLVWVEKAGESVMELERATP
jgi:hypothetical protein